MPVEILHPGPVSVASDSGSPPPTFLETEVVGGGSQWADADDGTYVVLAEGSADGGTADLALASVPAITFDPATCTNVVIRVRAEMDTAPVEPGFFFGVFDGAFFVSIVPLDSANTGIVFDEIMDLVYDFAAQSLTAPSDIAALFVAPRDIVVSPAITAILPGVYLSRIYEVSIEFTYGASSLIRRACRQYPRDDVLGIGSANRIHPPPRGRRVAGGFA